MYALIFPGQGAHRPEMLEGVSRHPDFARRYAAVCDYARMDPVRMYREGTRDVFNENRIASLTTVLVSTLSLDLFLLETGTQPGGAAGYSVGQWTAMYAAGLLDWERLMQMVCLRADLMDEDSRDEPTAMVAVLGVREDRLEAVLAALRAEGESIHISNYNCRGQVSIAGTVRALALAEAPIKALQPSKWLRLPVSGAWHCPLLLGAATRFRARLESVEFGAARWPIVDNVTGDWLPASAHELRDTLARQISSPVHWERGIRRLIGHGCERFVEVGYERTLSRFMFFIDRNVGCDAFYDRLSREEGARATGVQ